MIKAGDSSVGSDRKLLVILMACVVSSIFFFRASPAPVILRRAAVPHGTAVAAGAALPAVGTDFNKGENGAQKHQCQNYKGSGIHISSPAIQYTTSAAIQATTHWNTIMKPAQCAPSSRLTAAIAATQGV